MGLAIPRDWDMVIDGANVRAGGDAWTEVRSPATGELAGRVLRATAADVDRAVAASRATPTTRTRSSLAIPRPSSRSSSRPGGGWTRETSRHRG